MNRWPAADVAVLKALYPTTDTRELAAKMGRSHSSIRSAAKNRGLTKANARRPWSPEEIATLRKLYPDKPTKDIAALLNRDLQLIYRKATTLKLQKTDVYLAGPHACRLRRGDDIGKPFRFPKGHVPANKGLRRPGWYRGRMKETQFKRGRPAQEARNYVPLGTEKIDKKRGVLVRKLTDDPSIFPVARWRPVHVLAWEEKHGPVPEGHIVIFKRGMKTFDAKLITEDRLELVTLAENMRRNTYHRYPKEIARAIQLRGALVRQINRRMKQREEQNRGSSKPSL